MNFYVKLLLFTIFQSVILFQIIAQDLDQVRNKNQVIFKIKTNLHLKNVISKTEILNDISDNFENVEIVQKFSTFKNKNSSGTLDLSSFYKLTINSGQTVEEVIAALQKNDFIEYAVPDIIQMPLLGTDGKPSDPEVTSKQTYLEFIGMYSSWLVETGDSNIIIGIIDVGFDMDHIDLAGNIYINQLDPINGKDDDNDGYTDNYNGWDIAENDNDPTYLNEDDNHGTFIAGVAAARTDNGLGGAGTGFKCKFMPIKIANEESVIINAYESILYAANMGCKIILCGWGSPYSSGQYGQDIIDYVTHDLDVLVVAPAGNDGNNSVYYPAAYQHILSVAALKKTDPLKWEDSNYGYDIDVCAPGQYIYGPQNEDNFGTESGTSAAAALVAGGAGILRSYFKHYKAWQIAELIKSSTEEIYQDLPEYEDQLGTGKLNIYNALKDTTEPGIYMYNITASDNDDGVFDVSENISIQATFTNYLKHALNTNVTLTTTSEYLSIETGNITIGDLYTLDTHTNSENPFVIKVKDNVPENHSAILKFNISTPNNYEATYYHTICLNNGFINYDINNISTSFTSNGRVGYYDYPAEGLGMKRNNGEESLLYEAGLMIGNSNTAVSDNIYSYDTIIQDNDFSVTQPIRFLEENLYSNLDATGIFNDDSSETPLNLSITQNTYAWNSSETNNFVIVEYLIVNTSEEEISNIYAGMYADFDIGAADRNTTEYDLDNRLGYTYSVDGLGYAGIRLLSSGDFNFYGIDGYKKQNTGVVSIDDFTTDEKYTTLASNRSSAGATLTGNNVKQVISSGPHSISSGDTLTSTFAFMAGNHFADLIVTGVSAQEKYDSVQNSKLSANEQTLNSAGIKVFPNPVKNQINASIYLTNYSNINIKVSNISGKVIYKYNEISHHSGLFQKNINTSSWETGMYMIQIDAGNKRIVEKLFINP